MSDIISSSPKRRFTPFTWITSASAFLLAVAAFDPHFSNFELVSYVLRAFVPELMLLLMLGLLYSARKAKVTVLFLRHKLLFIILLFAVVSVTSSITDAALVKAAAAKNPDLQFYHGWSSLRVRLGAWRRLYPDRFSRSQVTLFRNDMQQLAIEAYTNHDMNLARTYLAAARDTGGGFGEASSTAGKGIIYLESSQKYVANMDSRIAAISKSAPLGPLELYLVRATNAISPSAQRAERADRLTRRDKQALSEAGQALNTCLGSSGTAVVTSSDAIAILYRMAEVRGDFTGFLVNETPQAWCARERGMVARQAKETGQTESDTAKDIIEGFHGTAESLWGLGLWKQPSALGGVTDQADASKSLDNTESDEGPRS